MYSLVPIEKLKYEEKFELKEILETISEILRRDSIEEAIPTRGEAVVGSYKTFQALKTIGVKYVPVTSSEDSIKLREPISLEALGFYDECVGDRVRVYRDTLELLYKNWPTPIVGLKSLSKGEVRVWAKLEGYNPYSNSIKDRIGWSMVREALEKNRLKEVVYEATSTNTGIALASISNILNFKTRLYVPESIQKVTDVYLKVLGAEVVRAPVSLTVEVIGEVDETAKREGATHLNQFENDANFKVHLRYTAKELDFQLRSSNINPKAIIGGVGTSGHMSAISLYFKSRYGERVRIVGVQPAPEEVIPGIRRVETGMKWIHWVKFDEIVDVEREEAIEEALNIARKEGILIGLSSGAVVKAFKEVVEGEGDYILIFPDTGYKYAEQYQEFLATHD